MEMNLMPKVINDVSEKFKEILDLEFETYSYSGRGMYGKKCVAITISRHVSEFGIVARVVSNFTEEYGGAHLDEIVSLFEGSKTDSMGLDTVMYFPDIEWVWEDEDSDDEDGNED
jgi:hypothetical protein